MSRAEEKIKPHTVNIVLETGKVPMITPGGALSAMEQHAVDFAAFIEENNWIFDPVNKCWFSLNNDIKTENLSALYQIFNNQ